MKYIFLLSGENVKFAAAEAKALFNVKDAKLNSRALIAEINDFDMIKAADLAYTHRICEYLFDATNANVINKTKKFNFQTIYKNNFAVRIINTGNEESKFTEKQLGSIIWRNLGANKIKPRVKLENSSTQIDFIFSQDNFFCGKLILKSEHDFEQRKAHKRKVLHPSSLHPKLARGMVNLLGADKGNKADKKNKTKDSVICDSFVGTGGILIEAGLLGYKTIGFDINKWMVKAANENLKSYKIKNYKIINTDALEISNYKTKSGNIKYICTDLPYAINTKEVDILKLYASFFALLRKIRVKRAVIGLPYFTNYKNINYKKLIASNKLKCPAEFEFYIHKNLRKKVFVIES
ncbi:RsmD family RNA methyltransferase [Candidatus Woesearchaeota archaeon]|nr:RsmD family RNA methyltransferase [Candidatus Woesearchaeota archaeon]